MSTTYQSYIVTFYPQGFNGRQLATLTTSRSSSTSWSTMVGSSMESGTSSTMKTTFTTRSPRLDSLEASYMIYLSRPESEVGIPPLILCFMLTLTVMEVNLNREGVGKVVWHMNIGRAPVCHSPLPFPCSAEHQSSP